MTTGRRDVERVRARDGGVKAADRFEGRRIDLQNRGERVYIFAVQVTSGYAKVVDRGRRSTG